MIKTLFLLVYSFTLVNNLQARSIEQVFILSVSDKKNVFSINSGAHDSIKPHDLASFFKIIDHSTKQILYLGTAEAVKVYPHKSLWQIIDWEQKSYLEHSKRVAFFHMAHRKDFINDIQTQRELDVLHHTHQSQLSSQKVNSKDLSQDKLSKYASKYQDHNNNSLDQMYIESLRPKKLEEEERKKLFLKKFRTFTKNFINKHINKNFKQYQVYQDRLNQNEIKENKITWSDSLSDTEMKRLVELRGEIKEIKRQEYVFETDPKFEIGGSYSVGLLDHAYTETGQKFDLPYGFNLYLELPFGLVSRTSKNWSLKFSYSYLQSTYDYYHFNVSSRMNSFRGHLVYYLLNDPFAIRKLQWSIEGGLTLGHNTMRHDTYQVVQNYSVVGFPSLASQLKYRISNTVGMHMGLLYEKLKVRNLDPTLYIQMPEEISTINIIVSGGLSVYF